MIHFFNIKYSVLKFICNDPPIDSLAPSGSIVQNYIFNDDSDDDNDGSGGGDDDYDNNDSNDSNDDATTVAGTATTTSPNRTISAELSEIDQQNRTSKSKWISEIDRRR